MIDKSTDMYRCNVLMVHAALSELERALARVETKDALRLLLTNSLPCLQALFAEWYVSTIPE